MIEIIHASLAEALSDLRAVPIASVIADPPYAEIVHRKATSNGTGGVGPVARDMGFTSLTPRFRAEICELCSFATRWSILHSDIETAHRWRETMAETPEGPRWIREIPWVRWSQPQLSGDRPPSGCETILSWHAASKASWNGPGSLVAFDAKSLRGKEKYSCEKPLDLVMSLVSWFSSPGDLIVDPCCGSGTTGVAARILGRDCILVDPSEDAVLRAQQRVDEDLTDRDRERVGRWIEAQDAWIATHQDSERVRRAREDTERVRAGT